MKRRKWAFMTSIPGFFLILGTCWSYDFSNDVKDQPLYWVGVCLAVVPMILPARWINK